MKRLKALGLKKLYIHTDGWGKDGYDNKHPYILPPCEEAGGWDGFRKFSEVCRELGFVFALHDQYRDYYYDSPVFDKEKAVTNIDGTNPYCSIWDGGEHSYLCSEFALDAVKRTYSELEEHGVDVQGAYLDVFSIMQGDECFHKEHRLTREESMKFRGECFDYLNENKPLREEIVKSGGCLISECPPKHGMMRHSFPVRNRLLSALSLGVAVVEADFGSGALITARHACEQGKDVFVIPGNPTLKQYKGSNELLRDGAKPLIDASDIFNEYILRFSDKLDLKKAFEKQEKTVRK